MGKPKLVVWGASGHAKVVADIIRLRGEYEIVGFLDDVNPLSHGGEFFGARILGGVEQLENLREQGVSYMIVGFGQCDARLKTAEIIKRNGFLLATAIHPAAVVARDVVIPCGSVVAAGAVINPGCIIGENVIINTGARVDHDCRIADGAHICPGVVLAGNVTVGKGTWVGLGANVIEKITIGAFSFIGVGSVVTGDIPDGVAAFGSPARVTRDHPLPSSTSNG